MSIYFKWRKHDSDTANIMADVGYYGNRNQIGIVRKLKGNGLVAILDDIGKFAAHNATELKVTVIEKVNEYDNVLVPRANPFNGGKIVMVRRGDVGGCCDPTTETYHSM